jgi:apolipoprotein N-acyltransferase
VTAQAAAAAQEPRVRRLPWLAGYALVTFFSFPHPIAGRVVDGGIALAWVGPALLLLGLRGLPPGRAARLGFAAALVAHTAILHWIWIVTVVYGHAPAIAGVVGPIALGAYIAAFTGAFAGLAALLAHAGLARPFALAAAWTALDHFRSFALSGFPWATLGYAQHENPLLLGLASVTGVYGLSFVSVLGAAALAEAATAWRAGRRPGPAVWAALGAVVALHGAGWLLAREASRPAPRTVRIAVLQGNVDQGVKWSPERAEEIWADYVGLVRDAVGQGAVLVVWPETSVPGLVERDPELRARLSALARETGSTMVLGAVGFELDPVTRDPLFFDSAFVLGPDGAFLTRYDKSHLVPFGEYVPLRDLLGHFLRAVARGIARDNVTPGPGPRALTLPAPGGPIRGGVPICYELLFPDLVRRMVDQGAGVLLGITNDAWYGKTGAPYQFLALTAVRSAETRVWTARAANTGVSAIIDSRGRVRAQTRIFERDLLVADVPLRPPPLGGSFYTRHGDVFAAACWIVTAGLVGLAGWRRRGASRGGGGRSDDHE